VRVSVLASTSMVHRSELRRFAYFICGTSRTQYPNVPKLTDEWRMCVSFVSVTPRSPTLFIIGAEMVTKSSKMLLMKRRAAPTLHNHD